MKLGGNKVKQFYLLYYPLYLDLSYKITVTDNKKRERMKHTKTY